MAGIPTANILQPGLISTVGGVNAALLSQLQLLKPQYYSTYVNKYGTEDFTWFLSTYGGMEEVKNASFFWFENRGKLMGAFGVQTQVTTPAVGATVTVVVAPGFHFNNGTQSGLRVGETLRIASNNVEGTILTINTTTPFAHSCTVAPKKTTVAFAGSTGSLLAGEILYLSGIMDAGEGSNSNTAQPHLDVQYTNTVTEMRESWQATDRAEMAQVWYDNGVQGSELAGVGQAGTSYFTYKGLVKAEQRFANNVEFKLMFGDSQNNTNINTSAGSQGIIPKILVDGETVGYTPGALDLAKLHEITRIMDVNGCAKQAIWLQDVFQAQNFSDGLFKDLPAGAFKWGDGEKSQEASLAYGFENVMIDQYMFQRKKYKQFNGEVRTGVTPNVDFFRNFGVIMPQGNSVDAKNVTQSYKNITIMYQAPVGGGTVGNGIRVWQHGGASMKATTGLMQDNVEMITYRGSRVVAANQFIIVQSA